MSIWTARWWRLSMELKKIVANWRWATCCGTPSYLGPWTRSGTGRLLACKQGHCIGTEILRRREQKASLTHSLDNIDLPLDQIKANVKSVQNIPMIKIWPTLQRHVVRTIGRGSSNIMQLHSQTYVATNSIDWKNLHDSLTSEFCPWWHLFRKGLTWVIAPALTEVDTEHTNKQGPEPFYTSTPHHTSDRTLISYFWRIWP